ncbi:MAG: O-antigen ligase family protein [Sphingobacteriia bacterium]|nr:O-antigen ligase family protein [Sphingobacteriia bacterium]
MRIDNLCSVLLLVYFLFIKAVLKPGSFQKDVPGFVLLFFFIHALLVSYFYSPDKQYSIIQTIGYFSCVFSYFLPDFIIKKEADIILFVKKWILVSLYVEVIFILVFFASYLSRIPMYGMNLVENEFEPFGIYGTMVEPNIFGGYMLITFIMSFILLKEKMYLGLNKKTIVYAVILSLIGLLLSFTRGVWLSGLFCLILYSVKDAKSFKKNIGSVFLGIAILAILIFIMAFVLNIEIVKYKILNIVSTDVGTGEGRIIIWARIMDNWIEKGFFWLGNGTYGSFDIFNFEFRTGWTGNLLLQILTDYGLIGILILLAFIFMTVKNTLVKTDSNFMRAMQYIVRYCCIGIFMASYTSNQTAVIFPWIIVGIGYPVYRLIKKDNVQISRKLLNPAI